jgi:hypothetical protein
MLTYQVKIKVEANIEAEWLQWMKTAHIPDMIATGLIQSFQIMKADSETCLYLFHYQFGSISDYQYYEQEFAPALKAHPVEKVPNQFTAEREVLHWV